MATNIDKALYQQPMGIDALGEQESPLRSRSLIPKKSPLAWTGWRSPSRPEKTTMKKALSDNLAEYIKSGALQSLARGLGV
jgi:hypothetical protein